MTTPVTADYGYDTLGRLTAIDAGTGLVQFVYAYEAEETTLSGNRLLITMARRIINTYSYDAIDGRSCFHYFMKI